jgi:hypothetical protein
MTTKKEGNAIMNILNKNMPKTNITILKIKYYKIVTEIEKIYATHENENHYMFHMLLTSYPLCSCYTIL